MPSRRMAIYQAMGALEEHFDSLFLEELDSAFTADIICCSQCRQEFAERWPHVARADENFADGEVSLDWFFDASDFPSFFDWDTFSRLVRENVSCPRCESPIGTALWAYNFPFPVPEGFETSVRELAERAVRTPSLLPSHPLANQVERRIRDSAPTASHIAAGTIWYRGRAGTASVSMGTADFGPPPESKATEGRFNHRGFPAHYLASDLDTCQRELGDPMDGIWIGTLELLVPLRVLDLVAALSTEDEILGAVVASSLVSSPADEANWRRPEYVFTRFISDCALEAGFQAIAYPSVALGPGYNVAVLWLDSEWTSRFRVRSFAWRDPGT